jgi:aspartate aminotransferase-like enzyme
MKEQLIMTPGPTCISEEVRLAMAKPITNPDLDMNFLEFYKETCEQLKRLLSTQNDTLILAGEGILGLEAACASLIEKGDQVLCLDNGIFGNGFGDFAKMYGAEVTYLKMDYEKALDVQVLEDYLKTNSTKFKIATLVHCETPSGITNPIEKIGPLLNQYGILSVVDAVSSVGGEPVEVDQWKIDILLGGSQKCLSAAPGLTFLSVSQSAWDKILNRKEPIIGFYANLSIWKNWYEEKWFPYTQPISDLYGFQVAVERLLNDSQRIERHARLAEAVRQTLLEAGFELYPKSGHSNTVTTVKVPEGISFEELYNTLLEEHQVMIAGAFDFLKDQVFRIGHMGENCYEDKLFVTMKALDAVFEQYGVKKQINLYKTFVGKI